MDPDIVTMFKMDFKKLAFVALAILVVLVVVSACNPTTTSSPMIVFAEAAPTPPVKCQNDFQCPPELFCRSTGVCSACVDCPKQHRLPPPNNACARGSSECGGCHMGYKLVGDHCTDEDHETLDNPGSGILHKFEKAADNNLDSEDFDNDSDNFIVWIYGVLSLLGLIGAVFIIAHLVVRRKNKRNVQRSRLLSSSGERGPNDHDQSDGFISQAPTAPLLPDEYNQPPFAYAMTVQAPSKSPMDQFIRPAIRELLVERNLHLPHQSSRIVNAVSVCAVPFNAGNAAGDWANQAAPAPAPAPAPENQAVQQMNNDDPQIPHQQNVTDGHVENGNAEIAPQQALPVQAPPVQALPVQALPVQSPPVQALPVQALPVQGPSVQAPPVQTPPVQAPPIPALPVQAPNQAMAVLENVQEALPALDDANSDEERDLNEAADMDSNNNTDDEDDDEDPFFFSLEIDATCMNMPSLTNASHASSSTSMALSAYSSDSGTGTSNEDDSQARPRDDRQVPNIDNAAVVPLSQPIDQDEENLELYNDDIGDDEDMDQN
ncbi:uncharacterized protein LOC110849564 isoform X2 [Folsomia candida]|uniref:uncharacterized protein LOC110849564 isoform X2 n=1 Tax=Folsomia candida TaxID=158441 RepID=UPI000B904D6A|nr:uncharacterized protein LOC110849564 isoform X2 [Folsomia candida]